MHGALMTVISARTWLSKPPSCGCCCIARYFRGSGTLAGTEGCALSLFRRGALASEFSHLWHSFGLVRALPRSLSLEPLRCRYRSFDCALGLQVLCKPPPARCPGQCPPSSPCLRDLDLVGARLCLCLLRDRDWLGDRDLNLDLVGWMGGKSCCVCC